MNNESPSIQDGDDVFTYANKRFLRQWMSRGIDGEILRKFTHAMEENGVLSALIEDTKLLQSRGITLQSIFEALLAAWYYHFLTWSDFPLRRDEEVIDEWRQRALQLGITAIFGGRKSDDRSSKVELEVGDFADEVSSSPSVRRALQFRHKLDYESTRQILALEKARQVGTLSDAEFEKKFLAIVSED